MHAVISDLATDTPSVVPLENITTSQNQLPLRKLSSALRAPLAGTLATSRWLPLARAAHLGGSSQRKDNSFVTPATLESINFKKGGTRACHAEKERSCQMLRPTQSHANFVPLVTTSKEMKPPNVKLVRKESTARRKALRAAKLAWSV